MKSERRQPAHPWASETDELARALAVNPATGLSAAEATERLATHGPNELRRIEKRSVLEILFAQLKSAVVWLLILAAAVSAAFGDLIEAGAIVGVVVINTLLGFVTELRASRSMEALRELGAATAAVRRDGRALTIGAAEVVPGDVVYVEAGDVVTADLRIVEGAALSADESALTGESAPVDKQVASVAADAV